MTTYRGHLQVYDWIHLVAEHDAGPMTVDDVRRVFDTDTSAPEILAGGIYANPEEAEWLTATTGCELDFDRLTYILTLRDGPAGGRADVTAERVEALPAFRGMLDTFDKASEELVAERDVGLWSIDEFRRIFLDGVDQPIFGTFEVTPKQAEAFAAKTGLDLDLDRFIYQFEVQPET